MSFQFNLSSDDENDDEDDEQNISKGHDENNDGAQRQQKYKTKGINFDENSDDQEAFFGGFGSNSDNGASVDNASRFVTPNLDDNDENNMEDDEDDFDRFFMNHTKKDDSPFASVTAAAAATDATASMTTSVLDVSTTNNEWDDDEYINWHDEHNTSDQDDDDGDGGESVDWEEGNDDDDENDIDNLSNEQKEKLKTFGVMKEVTFDFGDGGELVKNEDRKDSSSKKNKKKRLRRLKQLTVSYETEQLLMDLHRTHRLCLISHLIYVSRLAQIPNDGIRSMELSLTNPMTAETTASHCCTDDDWSLLIHLLYSLIPDDLWNILFPSTSVQHQATSTITSPSSRRVIPTPRQLHAFSMWFFDFVNGYVLRIRSQRQRDVAMGAPNTYGRGWTRRRRRQQSTTASATTTSVTTPVSQSINLSGQSPKSYSSTQARYASRYSPIYIRFRRIVHTLTKSVNSTYQVPDDDEDYLIECIDPMTIMTLTYLDKALLYMFITKYCLGWKRLRFISSIEPMPRHLTMDHPLLEPSSTSKYHIDLTSSTPNDDEESTSRCNMETMKCLFQIVHLTCGSSNDDNESDDDDKKPAAVTDKKGSRKRNNSSKTKEAPSSTKRKRQRANTTKDSDDKTTTKDNNGTLSQLIRKGSQQIIPFNQVQEALLKQTFENLNYVWIEVLCCQQTKTLSTKYKWIPIDIPHELINQPLLVEDVLTSVIRQKRMKDSESDDNGLDIMLDDGMNDNTIKNAAATNRTRGKGRNRRSNSSQRRHQWMPSFRESGKSSIVVSPKTKTNNKFKEVVSYVVATEIKIQPQQQQQKLLSGLSLTDVTPRYATRWSQSLIKRGATKQQLLKNGGQCIDQWWIKCVQITNSSFSNKATNKKKENDIICLDMDDDNTNNGDGNKSKIINLSDNPARASENKEHDVNDNEEEEDIDEEIETTNDGTPKVINEAIPTNKNAFKNHPIYFLKSQLKQNEVLVPKTCSKHICGMFKGELVYKRCEDSISDAWAERKWLYKKRQVRLNELRHPIKYIKAPKKRNTKTSVDFQALADYGISLNGQEQQQNRKFKDSGTNNNNHKTKEEILREQIIKELDNKQDDEKAGMIRLYGKWQTDPWKPRYVGPNDPLPINEYRNIELELINPGLVHLDRVHMAKVAKKLSIPYAPCLIGFDHMQGKPTIRGIVVHEHNESLLESAFEEYQSFMLHKEYKKRQDDIYMKWKKLIVGVLTKQRLEQEYGNTNEQEEKEDQDDKEEKMKAASTKRKKGRERKPKSNARK